MSRYQPLEPRFWAKVQKTDACWAWTGNRVGKGYGPICFKGRCILATHASLLIHTGELPPKGLYVCHRCDNPACVRPDHLFVGAPAENNADMHRKGRYVKSYGEKHPAAKLTEQDVVAIRQSGETPSTLALKYGVAPNTIKSVRQGVNWKHVGMAVRS